MVGKLAKTQGRLYTREEMNEERNSIIYEAGLIMYLLIEGAVPDQIAMEFLEDYNLIDSNEEFIYEKD